MLLFALALIPSLPTVAEPVLNAAVGGSSHCTRSASALTLYGPPAICHPLRIGKARSLPWQDVDQLIGIDPNFDLENLVKQTIEILADSDDSIVHMETLRRATLYLAPMQKKFEQDQRRKVQLELEEELQNSLQRALALRKQGRADDQREALSWFDIAYLRGTMKQINIDADTDIRGPLQHALDLQPKDIGMHLGASLIHFRDSSLSWSYLDTALRLAQNPSRDLRWNFVNTAGQMKGISDFDELAKTARCKAD